MVIVLGCYCRACVVVVVQDGSTCHRFHLTSPMTVESWSLTVMMTSWRHGWDVIHIVKALNLGKRSLATCHLSGCHVELVIHVALLPTMLLVLIRILDQRVPWGGLGCGPWELIATIVTHTARAQHRPIMMVIVSTLASPCCSTSSSCASVHSYVGLEMGCFESEALGDVATLPAVTAHRSSTLPAHGQVRTTHHLRIAIQLFLKLL